MTETIIQYQNLVYQYTNSKKLAFGDVKIGKGEHTLLLGSSGKGKTTLLHLLAGLLPVKNGEVLALGQNMSEMTHRALDRFRGENFGLIFQQAHLIKSLSVLENLEVARFFGNSKRAKNELKQLLSDLGIAEIASKRVTEISQGQAQRVSIARALVNRPKIIFCDEPTASLDDHSCGLVVNLLKSQAETYGATLIIATHDHRIKSEFPKPIEL